MLDFIKSLFKSKTDIAQLVKEGAIIVDVRTKANMGQVIYLSQKTSHSILSGMKLKPVKP